MKPETAKPSLQMHLLCPAYIVLTITPLGFELQKFLAKKKKNYTIVLRINLEATTEEEEERHIFEEIVLQLQNQPRP
jgi:hypothetical protein